MNTKTLVLGVVVIVLVVLGVWYWGASKAPETAQAPADNSMAISGDVNSIDLGDLNSDFSDVDASLKSF